MYLNEITMNDVFSDRSSIQVQFRVGGCQVGFEVDTNSPETPQVVKQARRVELPKHLLKVGLKKECCQQNKTTTNETSFALKMIIVKNAMTGDVAHAMIEEFGSALQSA